MNLDDLTIGQAKQLAALFGTQQTAPATPPDHEPRAVVVCTDKRGVVFGATTNVHARPVVLTDARMCLYWSADVGGVFGLADIGPTADCSISATSPSVTLEGVTAVFAMTDRAAAAWRAAPVKGR